MKMPMSKMLRRLKGTEPTSHTMMQMGYDHMVQGGKSPGRGPRDDNTRQVPKRGGRRA